MVDAWNMPMRSNESSVLLVRTDYICIDMHARMQADTHLHLYKDTDMLLRKECFSENTLENIDMGIMWQHSSVIFYIEPIPSGPFRSHPSDSQLAVAVVADVTAAYFASRWLRTKSWISCWPIDWRRPKTRNHLSGWERRSRIDEDSLDSPIYDSMMSILSRYIVFLLFFLAFIISWRTHWTIFMWLVWCCDRMQILFCQDSRKSRRQKLLQWTTLHYL
jgi:hypothetical protein